jgi:hypothetical protein
MACDLLRKDQNPTIYVICVGSPQGLTNLSNPGEISIGRKNEGKMIMFQY